MTVLKAKVATAVLAMSVIFVPGVFADAYFDKGKQLYDKRNFSQAVTYFHKSAEESPWDSSAAYYEALCYHNMRDYKNAAAAYRHVVEHFPGSAAYVNAAAALKVLDPGYFKSAAAGAGATASSAASGSGSGDDLKAMLAKVQISAPNECKIPVNRVTDKNWVDGSVNGRSLKFDFGGDSTTLTAKDATVLGLKGKSGRVPVSMRVGQISEIDFPILIEDGDHSRLGSEFFQKLAYRLDQNQLLVTKSSGGSSYDIPFTASGKDLKINVTVNGRSCTVVFDVAGGEDVVPRSRTKEFGLDVNDASTIDKYNPDTNPEGPLRGQPGYGEMKTVSTADANVVIKGPISGQVRFKIDDRAQDAKVGPGAFAGWKYQIDPNAKVIRFSR